MTEERRFLFLKVVFGVSVCLLIASLAFLGSVWVGLRRNGDGVNEVEEDAMEVLDHSDKVASEAAEIIEEDENEVEVKTEPLPFVLQQVSFSSQAPSGQWDNDTFQNGCEEASMIMAMAWVKGEELTKDYVEREIERISDYERGVYGHAVDQSAKDMAQVMRDYYDYDLIEVEDDVDREMLVGWLSGGKLVIAPMNGRLLGNPHFTAPGPLQHMVVVIGYDLDKEQFITNDPGTRYGEGYVYDMDLFVNAIRDYPTGEHEPIVSDEKRVVIVSR